MGYSGYVPQIAQGLRQIGRRDLIEYLILYVRHDSSGIHKRCSGLIKLPCWHVLSVTLISVIVAILYTAEDSVYIAIILGFMK